MVKSTVAFAEDQVQISSTHKVLGLCIRVCNSSIGKMEVGGSPLECLLPQKSWIVGKVKWYQAQIPFHWMVCVYVLIAFLLL